MELQMVMWPSDRLYGQRNWSKIYYSPYLEPISKVALFRHIECCILFQIYIYIWAEVAFSECEYSTGTKRLFKSPLFVRRAVAHYKYHKRNWKSYEYQLSWLLVIGYSELEYNNWRIEQIYLQTKSNSK